MSEILVTGGTGFMGRALVRVLTDAGYDVMALGTQAGDIACKDTVASLYTQNTKHIFHLAGRTFVPESWRAPEEFLRVNVLGTENILELASQIGANVTFASAYVYGVPVRLPISEDDVAVPNNPYALSKYLAEQLCAYHARTHSLNVAVVRPFNVYGPGQGDSFLIPTIVRQVSAGGPIVVKDLRPRRDHIYLDDVIDALVRTIKAPAGCRIYNVGSGTSVSVEETIEIIQTVAGTDFEVRSSHERRRNEIDDVCADIRKAENELGWKPRTGLRQGIEATMRATVL